MKPEITLLSVVMFDSLRQSDDFDSMVGFEFTTGDSEYMLISVSQVKDEVKAAQDTEDDWDELLEDLNNIPEGVLVAFNG